MARIGVAGCGLLSHRKCFNSRFAKVNFRTDSSTCPYAVMIKDELTDLCGNRLWQNDFINTLCEIRVWVGSG